MAIGQIASTFSGKALVQSSLNQPHPLPDPVRKPFSFARAIRHPPNVDRRNLRVGHVLEDSDSDRPAPVPKSPLSLAANSQVDRGQSGQASPYRRGNEHRRPNRQFEPHKVCVSQAVLQGDPLLPSVHYGRHIAQRLLVERAVSFITCSARVRPVACSTIRSASRRLRTARYRQPEAGNKLPFTSSNLSAMRFLEPARPRSNNRVDPGGYCIDQLVRSPSRICCKLKFSLSLDGRRLSL